MTFTGWKSITVPRTGCGENNVLGVQLALITDDALSTERSEYYWRNEDLNIVVDLNPNYQDLISTYLTNVLLAIRPLKPFLSKPSFPRGLNPSKQLIARCPRWFRIIKPASKWSWIGTTTITTTQQQPILDAARDASLEQNHCFGNKFKRFAKIVPV